ncbi:MAG: aminoacyl-tRNA hydrolase, partial [Simkaniaceae bacterium]|nr:aminoacyl-tRNA hydrolase [Simkaniaceae bacterium]
GTNEYKRLRIGIGSQGDAILADYVLGTFSAKEQEELETILDHAVEAIESFLEMGSEKAMKQVNTER